MSNQKIISKDPEIRAYTRIGEEAVAVLMAGTARQKAIEMYRNKNSRAYTSWGQMETDSDIASKLGI